MDTGHLANPGCHFQSSGDIDPLVSAVSVPTAELGATFGTFNVSADGHARYAIPIEVPPGIGGLAPTLAFEYDSGSGNGLMGIGWQVSGLSAITRCPRTIPVDGVRRPVGFDATDAFCLDGKRLIPVGTNEADHVFRTENESFAKVVANAWNANSGPASFTAYEKDGRVLYFGSDPASNSQLLVYGSGGQAVAIGSWHLDAAYDRSPAGTRYTVKYINASLPDGSRDFRPASITYNSTPGSGGTTVSFRYEAKARQDLARVYRGGSRFSNPYRLVSVDIGQCDHLVRIYKLTYEYAPVSSTGRSRLMALQECANTYLTGPQVSLACKPATQFFWQNGSQGWASPSDVTGFKIADPYWMFTRLGPPLPPYATKAGEPMSTIPPPIGWNSGAVYEPLMVDLDGDGKPEMIEFTGFTDTRTTLSVHTLEDDGGSSTRAISVDTTEVRRVPERSPSGSTDVCRDPNARPINYKTRHSAQGNAQDGGKSSTHAIPMDYNNDGRIDLVLTDPTNNWIVLQQTSTSNSLHTLSFRVVDTSIPRSCPNTQGYEPVLFVDLNGDGLRDMLECRKSRSRWSWWYRQTTPAGFNPIAWNTAENGTTLAGGINPVGNADSTFFGQHCNYADLLVLDYNGDGAEDLLTTDESYYDEHAAHAIGTTPADPRLLRSLILYTPPDPPYSTSTSAHPPSFSGSEKGLSLPRFSGETANWVTASYHTVDFTGDGYQDVLVVENYRPRYDTDPQRVALSIYQNNSDGAAWFDRQIGKTTFDPWISGNMDLYGNHVGAFDLIVDANHDGKPDLLSMDSFYNDDQSFPNGVLQVYYFLNGLADRSHYNSRYEILRLDPSGTKYHRSCEAEVGGFGCGNLSSWPDDGGTYYRSGRMLAGYQMGALPPFPTMRIALPFIPLLADIDGDGLDDLVTTKPAGPGQTAGEIYQIHLAEGHTPDLLTEIRDGLNCPAGLPCTTAIPPTVAVSYGTLKSSATYTRNPTGCTFPQKCVPATGAITIVKSVSYDAENSHTREYKYVYEDARTDAQGRGALGFRTVTESRVGAGGSVFERVVKTYDNGIDLAGNSTYDVHKRVYPTAGMLLKEERVVFTDDSQSDQIVDTTTVSPTVHWLSDALVRVSSDSPTARTYFARHGVTTTTRTDNGTLVRSGELTRVYDRFGDVTSSVQTSAGQDPRVDETISIYFDDPDNWLLGLPTNVTVKSSVSPGAAVVRELSSTYDTLTVTNRGVRGTGLLLSQTVEPNVPAQRLTTTFTRDYLVGPDPPSSVGNIVIEQVVGPTAASSTPDTANTRTTRYTFDDKAQFVKYMTNSLGHSATYTHDRNSGLKLGESIDNGTPKGITTRWAYDAFGRLAVAVDADGRSITTRRAQTSDTNPNLVVASYHNDGRRLFQYLDRLGRVVALGTCGSGSTLVGIMFRCQDVRTTTAYDDDGRVTKRSNPAFPLVAPQYTTYTYDNLGRETKRTYPDGGVVTTAYTGRTVKTTNARGYTTTIEQDVRGRVVRATDADGAAVTTSYGAFDLPSMVRSPAGRPISAPLPNGWRFTYDNYGRRIGLANAEDIYQSATTYNAFGEIETETNARREITRFTYDALGRLASRTDVEGTTTWTWDSAGTYGQVGKLAQVSIEGTGPDAGNTTRFAYSPVGQAILVEQTVGPLTLALGSTYNPVTGQLDTTSYPDNPTAIVLPSANVCSAKKAFKTRNVYDIVGNLKRIEDGCNPANPPFFTMNALEPAGYLASETRGGISTTRTYDPRGRLDVTKSTVGNTDVFDLDLDYDANGNVTRRTDALAPRTESYTYDALDRLTGVAAPTGAGYASKIRYDAAGNISSKDGYFYTYLNRGYPQAVTDVRQGKPYPHGSVSKTFAYDNNGNLRTPWGGGRITYSSFDKPRRFAHGATIDFSYDADRSRVHKASSISGDTYYLGGLYERHSQVTGSDTKWTHRYYIAAYGEVVAQVNRQQSIPSAPAVVETRQVLLNDALGTSGVVASTAGVVTERRQYSAFGELKSPAEAGPAGTPVTRGFTGHENDGAEFANLVNMKARMYDPRLGRFLNPDPHVTAPLSSQSHNRYSYVWNNPLRNSDPTGMDCDVAGQSCVDPLVEAAANQGMSEIGLPVPVKDQSIGVTAAALDSSADEARQPTFDAAVQMGVRDVLVSAASEYAEDVTMPTVYGQVYKAAKFAADPRQGVEDLKERMEATIRPFSPIASAMHDVRDINAIRAACGGDTPAACGYVGSTIFTRIAASVAAEIASLRVRAGEIHAELKSDIAESMRTTAIVRTESGDVFGGGGRDLSPAQRSSLQSGEHACAMCGAHAEPTAVNGALARGQTPRLIVATRRFCPVCGDILEGSGAVIFNAFSAGWEPPR